MRETAANRALLQECSASSEYAQNVKVAAQTAVNELAGQIAAGRAEHDARLRTFLAEAEQHRYDGMSELRDELETVCQDCNKRKLLATQL